MYFFLPPHFAIFAMDMKSIGVSHLHIFYECDWNLYEKQLIMKQ